MSQLLHFARISLLYLFRNKDLLIFIYFIFLLLLNTQAKWYWHWQVSFGFCLGNGTMSRRRISVKELGPSDHQGWLYRKKESKGFLGMKWKKYWFVLKKTALYWYNNQLVSSLWAFDCAFLPLNCFRETIIALFLGKCQCHSLFSVIHILTICWLFIDYLF